jgi:protein-export membrane protein SecD
MAVDANIIVFERIKEELRRGRTTLTAINAGFEKAFRAIIDSNVTTIIAGVVLFIVASGSIRGFAIVLLVGILASLFTAFFLTRFLLRLAARSQMIKTPRYLGLKEVTLSDKV